MVIKPESVAKELHHEFESSVVLYGNQTSSRLIYRGAMFESSVVLYGNQTHFLDSIRSIPFESSVVLYGNQT